MPLRCLSPIHVYAIFLKLAIAFFDTMCYLLGVAETKPIQNRPDQEWQGTLTQAEALEFFNIPADEFQRLMFLKQKADDFTSKFPNRFNPTPKALEFMRQRPYTNSRHLSHFEEEVMIFFSFETVSAMIDFFMKYILPRTRNCRE